VLPSEIGPARWAAPSSERQTLLELATSYSWKSMIRRITEPLQELVDDVAQKFGLSADQLEYFPGHIELDEDHEQMAARPSHIMPRLRRRVS
jgi:hypothetical protein